MKTTSLTTRKLAIMAMMSAISIILVYLIRFPIFPSAAFLEYDPADIPIILTTLLFGVGPGLMVTAVVSVLQGLTVSAGSGIIGIVMHLLATGSLVLVAGLIHRRGKSVWRLVIALLAGAITMVVTMAVWNVLFTPIFMGAPREVVLDMLVPIIIPFNAIKAIGNSFISAWIFVALRYTFQKARITV